MKTQELRKLIREEIGKIIKEVASTADEKVIKGYLQNMEDGVYILKGVSKGGGWNFSSLDDATPLFYTSNFADPNLKQYVKSGIVKVDISKGEINVSQY